MNREIARLNKRMRLGRAIVSDPVAVTSNTVNGTRVQFCTTNPADPVQRRHRKGGFFEMAELTNLAALFPKGGTFVDIGAHVGNHSLFAALFMDAGTVIPIEPHPSAYRLLIQNVLVNGASDRVDFSKLGCAVSAAEGSGSVKTSRRKPAATKLKQSGGKIAVLRGDALLADVTPDMIKIDTPGMAMEVLEGLSELFARCSPVLLIEIAAKDDDAFKVWATSTGYIVSATSKRNKRDLNYIMTSKTVTKPKAKPTVKKVSAAKKGTTVKKASTTKTAASKRPKATTTAKVTKSKVTATKPLLDKAF
jgi:FkbM family methyltransferase